MGGRVSGGVQQPGGEKHIETSPALGERRVIRPEHLPPSRWRAGDLVYGILYQNGEQENRR